MDNNRKVSIVVLYGQTGQRYEHLRSAHRNDAIHIPGIRETRGSRMGGCSREVDLSLDTDSGCLPVVEGHRVVLPAPMDRDPHA